MGKSLRVDPAQLQVTAESLSSHAESSTGAHTQAQSRAGSVALEPQGRRGAAVDAQ